MKNRQERNKTTRARPNRKSELGHFLGLEINLQKQNFRIVLFLVYANQQNLEKANTQKMIAKMGFMFCTTFSLITRSFTQNFDTKNILTPVTCIGFDF